MVHKYLVYEFPGVSPVSVLVVAEPIFVAVNMLSTVFQKYPSAPLFQFQTIWVPEATCVPSTGAFGELEVVDCEIVVGSDAPHELYVHTYLVNELLQTSSVSSLVVAVPISVAVE